MTSINAAILTVGIVGTLVFSRIASAALEEKVPQVTTVYDGG